MTAHTTITVHGERWDVPRGFGAQYRARAKDEDVDLRVGRPGKVIHAIATMLMLVGYEASTAAISDWPRRKRVEAFVYAMNEHLRASDNHIQAHPCPAWLPEPWRGPMKGDGVFCGPSPTVLA
jgi:hypothetical protein